MIFIVGAVIYTGTMIYSKYKNRHLKLLALGILLGLISYFSHGVLNNFLDTDKLAVPVWSFIAMLVALDVYHKEELSQEE